MAPVLLDRRLPKNLEPKVEEDVTAGGEGVLAFNFDPTAMEVWKLPCGEVEERDFRRQPRERSLEQSPLVMPLPPPEDEVEFEENEAS